MLQKLDNMEPSIQVHNQITSQLEQLGSSIQVHSHRMPLYTRTQLLKL